MRQTNLQSFNQKDIVTIIEPFLLAWGKMGRVLGHAGCKHIGNVLKSISGDLFDFRFYYIEKDLADVNNVAKIFETVMDSTFKSDLGATKRIGPTATSKVLHLIAPDFFVMWDDDIMKFKYEEPTYVRGSHYEKFLSDMKQLLERLNPTVTAFSEKYGKTKTKIIDEYN